MSITGEPGGPPVKTGNPVADINAGILAAVGILAAYAHKLATGQGQIVDTSLMEAALQQTYWHAAMYFATGRLARPDRLGAPADRALPGVSRERRLDQHRRREPGELGADRRRARASRVARRSALRDQLGAHGEPRRRSTAAMNAVLATRTKAQWIAAFDAAGVPVGPVHTIGEALEHPQTLARGMVVDLVHPQAGRYEGAGLPDAFFAPRRRRSTRPAPLLGEHTREVLREYAYSDAEIDALVTEGIVAEADGR